MLMWHRRLWLIDHGAALYFHHAWDDYLARSTAPFVLIRDHVLLPLASRLAEVDATLAPKLGDFVIDGIVDGIPAAWLGGRCAVRGSSRASRGVRDVAQAAARSAARIR